MLLFGLGLYRSDPLSLYEMTIAEFAFLAGEAAAWERYRRTVSG